MAEAFGIAGSVFGTVSLGLQLFKEISLYLDDIDGREEDLKEARDYATNIQLSLNALNTAISNAPTGDPATKNAIDSCKASWVSTVSNLLAVVKELRGSTISTLNSNTAKAKELCTKLKYPFKKQNIEKLEDILSRTNSVLQTILQVYQLNTGHATTSAINNMYQAVTNRNAISEKNKAALDEMYKTSQLHDDKLSTIQKDVRALLILTRASEDPKLLLRGMAQQVSDLTSRYSFNANLLQNSASESFNPSIQTTSYQSGDSMTFDAFCSCKTQQTRFSQHRWGPFVVEAEIRSREHHAPECPMSKLPASTRRTKRVLSLSIPTSQKLWRRASKVSLSFTTGAGILGLGQKLTWVATVDADSSPAFRMVRTIGFYEHLQLKDMRILLASCLRRLVWCYANYHAYVTDVNKHGDSIIEWALEHYQLSGSMTTSNADKMAELFEMLSVVTKPATYPRRVTAAPVPALLARSNWFFKCTRPQQVATALLSNYHESVGHCHRDWAISWWRGNGFASGSYTLFQSFPRVVESLEFGPLSQAILKQDRNGVQQFLQKYPSYINEINYCGQSPIHLAIETQNMDIIGIILQYANTEALNVMDNMGRYPIALAATSIGNHTGRVQENCGGFKVLEILLELETAIFPSSLQLGFMPSRNHGGNCTQGHKILIKGLAQRREGLKSVAYQRLSPSERQDLKIHQSQILDKNAARVQRQLEAQGYEIPTYLKVYETNADSTDFQLSIYSYICSGEVAEYARQLGFHYSSIELADYISTLATCMGTADCRAYIYTPFSCSYFCWMIDQGINVSSRIQSKRLPIIETELTIAHYFMARHGMMARGDRGFTMDCPMSLEAFRIVFSEILVDRCRCWCSPRGCTPLAKLFGGIHWFEKSTPEGDFIDRLIGVTENLIAGLFSTHTTNIDQYQWIYAAIVRYYTFAELGLRHGCCSIIGKASGPVPGDEFQEIEEEDYSLLELFEILLVEFEDSRYHDISLEEFFEWMRMKWAPRMQTVREELNSQKLTNEQLGDAESVGVVWEVYGPKPMEKEPDLPEWREFDLWDAMDQLDEIATDPERPAKESL
ncbi:uncharacterized protein FTJAE_3664 [Fusarium tjaetaba]|uniref:Fungal N-terminal domain-containing protein n=1 Tax=Fusarium tjaetaba TaxID=1567544 RepID=A0A8H5RZ30_9HYPO|nr:uncharacterized protein FTJAE_3664 [Fusarium tjaetaba]KAF5642507.1 hypothetical protein FTJAE_3664 [Fusarium tjaetaba]